VNIAKQQRTKASLLLERSWEQAVADREHDLASTEDRVFELIRSTEPIERDAYIGALRVWMGGDDPWQQVTAIRLAKRIPSLDLLAEALAMIETPESRLDRDRSTRIAIELIDAVGGHLDFDGGRGFVERVSVEGPAGTWGRLIWARANLTLCMTIEPMDQACMRSALDRIRSTEEGLSPSTLAWLRTVASREALSEILTPAEQSVANSLTPDHAG
jgi:hypothetical protein